MVVGVVVDFVVGGVGECVGVGYLCDDGFLVVVVVGWVVVGLGCGGGGGDCDCGNDVGVDGVVVDVGL